MSLQAAEMEAEPSKVAELEVYMHQSSPVVAKQEPVCAFYFVSSFLLQKCKCPISIIF
jgi:hypothetical protein